MVCIMNVCNIENLICNLMKLKLYKRKITFWGHKFGDQDWKLKKKPLQENKIFNKFLSFSWQGVSPKWRLSRVIVVCFVLESVRRSFLTNLVWTQKRKWIRKRLQPLLSYLLVAYKNISLSEINGRLEKILKKKTR